MVHVICYLNTGERHTKDIQVRDRAWFVRLYGEIIPELYLTCTMVCSVDLAQYGVPR